MDSSDSKAEFEPFTDYETRDWASFGLDPLLFPSFDKSTRKILFLIMYFLYIVRTQIPSEVQIIPNYLSLFLNSIHLMVLTRKTMRNNAVNIQLAGMAFNDICIVLLGLWANYYQIGNFDPSTKKNEIQDVPIVKFLTLNIAHFLKRNSVWLPILMALTRSLVISHIENPKYSFLTTRNFGLISVALEHLINLSIQIIAFLIITGGGKLSSDRSFRVYNARMAVYDEIAPIMHFTAPSLLYPFLTFLLLRALKKSRSKLAIVKKEEKNNNTTKMIITMTVFFMVSEILQGIGAFIVVFYGDNQGVYVIGESMLDIFAILSTANASTHFFICLKMSSSYREAFVNLFTFHEKNDATENTWKRTSAINGTQNGRKTE